MKIKSIEYSMTRQVTNFHPASYTISADLSDGDDLQKCCKELQEMTIRVLYKDSPVMRDSLIKQLCGTENVTINKKNTTNLSETKEKEDQTDLTNEDFPDFNP